jgi:hypothetical protein
LSKRDVVFRSERSIAMSKLHLTPEEEQELLAILERYLLDLRIEIVHTDNRDFRRALREREVFAKTLIERLKS